jgi:hypothetical protein
MKDYHWTLSEAGQCRIEIHNNKLFPSASLLHGLHQFFSSILFQLHTEEITFTDTIVEIRYLVPRANLQRESDTNAIWCTASAVVGGKRSLKKFANFLRWKSIIIEKEYGPANERKAGCEMLV